MPTHGDASIEAFERLAWARAVHTARASMKIAVIAVLAASCSLRGELRSELSWRGQVLRDWQVDDDDERMLVREGSRVVEYRIAGTEMTAIVSTQMYAIDTVTGLCFAGDRDQPVSCDAVARDPDLRPYVPRATAASARE